MEWATDLAIFHFQDEDHGASTYSQDIMIPTPEVELTHIHQSHDIGHHLKWSDSIIYEAILRDTTKKERRDVVRERLGSKCCTCWLMYQTIMAET